MKTTDGSGKTTEDIGGETVEVDSRDQSQFLKLEQKVISTENETTSVIASSSATSDPQHGEVNLDSKSSPSKEVDGRTSKVASTAGRFAGFSDVEFRRRRNERSKEVQRLASALLRREGEFQSSTKTKGSFITRLKEARDETNVGGTADAEESVTDSTSASTFSGTVSSNADSEGGEKLLIRYNHQADEKFRKMEDALQRKTGMMKHAVNTLHTEIREVAGTMEGRRVLTHQSASMKVGTKSITQDEKLAHQDLDNLQKENKALKDQNRRILASADAFKRHLDDAKSSLTRYQETIKRMEKEKSPNSGEVESLQRELDLQKKQAMEREISLRNQLATLEASNQKSVAHLESELNSAREMLHEKELEFSDQLGMADKTRQTSLGALCKKLEDSQGSKDAIETVLRDQLKIVDESRQEINRTLESLKEKVAEVEKAEGSVDIDGINSLDESGLTVIESLQKDLVELTASKEQMEKQLLSRLQHIEESKGELDSVFGELQKKLSDANNQVSQSELELSKKCDDLENHYRGQVDSLQKNLEESTRSKKETEERLMDQVRLLEESNLDAEEQLTRLRQELSLEDGNNRRHDEEMQGVLNALQQTKVAVFGPSEDKSENESRDSPDQLCRESLVNVFREEVSSLSVHLKHWQELLGNAERDNRVLAERVEEQKDDMKKLSKERDEAVAEVKSLQEANEALQKEIREAKMSLREVKSTVDKQAMMLSLNETQLQNLQQELEKTAASEKQLQIHLAEMDGKQADTLEHMQGQLNRSKELNLTLQNDLEIQVKQVMTLKAELRQLTETLTEKYENCSEQLTKTQSESLVKGLRVAKQQKEIEILRERVASYAEVSSALLRDCATRIENLEDTKRKALGRLEAAVTERNATVSMLEKSSATYKRKSDNLETEVVDLAKKLEMQESSSKDLLVVSLRNLSDNMEGELVKMRRELKDAKKQSQSHAQEVAKLTKNLENAENERNALEATQKGKEGNKALARKLKKDLSILTKKKGGANTRLISQIAELQVMKQNALSKLAEIAPDEVQSPSRMNQKVSSEPNTPKTENKTKIAAEEGDEEKTYAERITAHYRQFKNVLDDIKEVGKSRDSGNSIRVRSSNVEKARAVNLDVALIDNAKSEGSNLSVSSSESDEGSENRGSIIHVVGSNISWKNGLEANESDSTHPSAVVTYTSKKNGITSKEYADAKSPEFWQAIIDLANEKSTEQKQKGSAIKVVLDENQNVVELLATSKNKADATKKDDSDEDSEDDSGSERQRDSDSDSGRSRNYVRKVEVGDYAETPLRGNSSSDGESSRNADGLDSDESSASSGETTSVRYAPNGPQREVIRNRSSKERSEAEGSVYSSTLAKHLPKLPPTQSYSDESDVSDTFSTNTFVDGVIGDIERLCIAVGLTKKMDPQRSWVSDDDGTDKDWSKGSESFESQEYLISRSGSVYHG